MAINTKTQSVVNALGPLKSDLRTRLEREVSAWFVRFRPQEEGERKKIVEAETDLRMAHVALRRALRRLNVLRMRQSDAESVDKIIWALEDGKSSSTNLQLAIAHLRESQRLTTRIADVLEMSFPDAPRIHSLKMTSFKGKRARSGKKRTTLVQETAALLEILERTLGRKSQFSRKKDGVPPNAQLKFIHAALRVIDSKATLANSRTRIRRAREVKSTVAEILSRSKA